MDANMIAKTLKECHVPASLAAAVLRAYKAQKRSQK